MEVKYYQTEEFRQLNEIWQKKLEESKFVDIEKGFHSLPAAIDVRNKRFKTREQTEEYYDIARHYLFNGTFTSIREREIWEYHSNGEALRQIALKMNISKSTAFYQIKKVLKRIRGK